MSEEETTLGPEPSAESPTARPPLPRMVRRRSRIVARTARWAGELLTVFVGVYAAFLFNNYQSHRQEQARREQILTWMDETYTAAAADAKTERSHIQIEADKFNRQLDAGKMPELGAINWRTDYDPSDVASLLSSGGFDLLEVETVRDIKESESTLRQMISVIRHAQQVSDTYILPSLDKDPNVFYDLKSKKLLPNYSWYPDFYTVTLQGYDKLQPQLEKLLAQIHRERQRDR